jgi:hypothetical protein
LVGKGLQTATKKAMKMCQEKKSVY